MPFTPFHMGAALLVKPVLRRRFSVLVFGVSQIAIDLEPLMRMMRGDQVLHGWTHTLVGAVGIGAVVALISRVPVNAWLRWMRTQAPTAPSLAPLSWPVAFGSAYIGTGSHLLLDGVMHADMRPFAPLTASNPLLGVLSLTELHLGLVVAGIAGLALLALREAPQASGPA